MQKYAGLVIVIVQISVTDRWS